MFYIDWSRVQQGINLPGTVTDPCGSAYVANAGKAQSDGFDVALRVKATQHLTLSATANVTRAIITQPAPDTGTTYGTHLEGVPNFTATAAATYSAPLSGALSHFESVDMDWVGRSYGTFSSDTPAYDYPEYAVLNLSAGVNIRDLRIALFAKNALNQARNIQPGTVAYPLSSGAVYYSATTLTPRTIGVSASVRF